MYQFIQFYNGHIVLNYTAHIVYSLLNSYVYIHSIWTINIYYYYVPQQVPHPVANPLPHHLEQKSQSNIHNILNNLNLILMSVLLGVR